MINDLNGSGGGTRTPDTRIMIPRVILAFSKSNRHDVAPVLHFKIIDAFNKPDQQVYQHWQISSTKALPPIPLETRFA